MKRKNVKFYIGNQPCSVWRITLVNYLVKIASSNNLANLVFTVDPDKKDHVTPSDKLDIFRTYFVFGVVFPDAISHITYDRHQWQVYKFDRLRYLPYDANFQV